MHQNRYIYNHDISGTLRHIDHEGPRRDNFFIVKCTFLAYESIHPDIYSFLIN
jgi:hypothetical protein